MADAVRPSPARAEPHDASTWLPVPAPESLPSVEALLRSSPDAEVPLPREVPVGLPSPARAEPHDETAWLPLPELESLPSIDELLVPDPTLPPLRELPDVAPSPARAEPHDETAWLPLPDLEALPHLADLGDSDRVGEPPRDDEPAPESPRRSPRRSRLGRHRVPVRAILLATLVVATLGGAAYGATWLLDAGADVDLRVDGRLISAETGVSTVGSFLREHKVALGAHDRVTPGLSSPIENQMTVRVLRAYPVSVNIDGEAKTVYTTRERPRAFLAEAAEQLKLSPSVALRGKVRRITPDTAVVMRTRRKGVLLLDGQAVTFDRPVQTVRELLEDYEVVLGPADFTRPYGVDDVLPVDNPSVAVVRVATETETVDETFTLPDERRADAELGVGLTRVVEGVVGAKRVTYNIIRHDGSIADRIPISVVPIVEAQPKVTYYGTKADPRWDKIAQCETGGNWGAKGPTYQGGLGIFYKNWSYYGGKEFAPNAGQATREEQIIVAERIKAEHTFSAWGCGRMLGYGGQR